MVRLTSRRNTDGNSDRKSRRARSKGPKSAHSRLHGPLNKLSTGAQAAKQVAVKVTPESGKARAGLGAAAVGLVVVYFTRRPLLSRARSLRSHRGRPSTTQTA